MSAGNRTDAWMPLWIGDYLADTMSLTRDQHGAYLLLIMAYWRNGGPLLADDDELAAMARATDDEWPKLRVRVLQKFFIERDGHWCHDRIDRELAESRARAEKAEGKARAAAQARWSKPSSDAPSNAPSTPQAVLNECPSPSPSPISPSLRSGDGGAAKRGTRLADDWTPSEADLAFCRERRPDLDPASVALQFRNYWTAKAGKDATKLDWGRTWQNWVLGQKTVGPAPRAGAPPIETFRERDQRQAAERVAAFAPQAAARSGLRTIDITPQQPDQPRIGNAA